MTHNFVSFCGRYTTEDKFSVHNFRCNQFCSWCMCCKSHNNLSMTLGDFGEQSAHRATVMTHEQFMQSGAEASRCLPMFQ